MAFRFAILALLSEAPSHGYGLRGALDDLLGAFWPVNQGQIYATLSRLASQALIEPCPEQSDPRGEAGPRRPHVIAPEGRRVLERWLEQSWVDVGRPNELIARIALLAALDRQKPLRALIAVQRRRCSRMVSSQSRPARLANEAARQHFAAELEWLDLLEKELLGSQARS